MQNTYDLYMGEQLVIADRIQKLRFCLLIHSCIYYHLNSNIVSDSKWDSWARELVKLQKDNPDISKNIRYDEAFKDWDASTGAFLPITDSWVVNKAKWLLRNTGSIETEIAPQKPVTKIVKKVSGKKKLF